MFEGEIKILRAYAEMCERELESEVNGIGNRIEEETRTFFSRFAPEMIDDSLKGEYRDSLRIIYGNMIEKRRAAVAELWTGIRSIERRFTIA